MSTLQTNCPIRALFLLTQTGKVKQEKVPTLILACPALTSITKILFCDCFLLKANVKYDIISKRVGLKWKKNKKQNAQNFIPVFQVFVVFGFFCCRKSVSVWHVLVSEPKFDPTTCVFSEFSLVCVSSPNWAAQRRHQPQRRRPSHRKCVSVTSCKPQSSIHSCRLADRLAEYLN